MTPGTTAAFRQRRVGDQVVVTSLDGSFILLAPAEFERFRRGEVQPSEPLYEELASRNLLRDRMDVPRAVQRMKARLAFLGRGPSLHVVVVTRRCNQTCVYCHSSRAPLDAAGVDMSEETADRVVDRIFGSPSPHLTIEFQGGEPLLAFPLIQRIVARARHHNERARRELAFALVTNLSCMDEEKLEWLLEHRVQICTSVDGHAALHDRQRRLPGGSAYDEAARWIRRINETYRARGMDPTLYRVEALLTTTRDTLDHPEEVVDAYVELGCRAIFLRPLDPFGFAARTAGRLEYPRTEYLAFYRRALQRAIEHNLRGTEILERFAAIFLTKILHGRDPGYLDIQSPCGAGVGQLAYDHDGRVFTRDEGRMLAANADDTFLLGDVARSSTRELIGHPTVRTLQVASNLDGLPGCTSCAYQPYCGVCPVHSHRTQGTLFARVPESSLCAVHMGIQDTLFELLGHAGPEVRTVLERWTTVRPRPELVQPVAPLSRGAPA